MAEESKNEIVQGKSITNENSDKSSSEEKLTQTKIDEVTQSPSQEFLVEAENVGMQFKVRETKVDTLKERVVQFFKRKNKKKIERQPLLV